MFIELNGIKMCVTNIQVLIQITSLTTKIQECERYLTEVRQQNTQSQLELRDMLVSEFKQSQLKLRDMLVSKFKQSRLKLWDMVVSGYS